MTGSIDQLSEQELEARMKDILKDHKDIIEGTAVDVVQETIIEDTIIEEEPEEVVKPKNIKKLN